ncbi:hypothetical protein FACS1894120_3020 [Clostridia bacterium]|nr:hypothetical protein FACS1894120_3020 [Clostridia bacterium]
MGFKEGLSRIFGGFGEKVSGGDEYESESEYGYEQSDSDDRDLRSYGDGYSSKGSFGSSNYSSSFSGAGSGFSTGSTSADSKYGVDASKSGYLKIAGVGSDMPKIKYFAPQGFEEIFEICKYLKDGCEVILSFEKVHSTIACRYVDFFTGAAYMADGKIRNTGPMCYTVAPGNFEFIEDEEVIPAKNESADNMWV